MAADVIIDCRDLTRTFRSGDTAIHALDHVDLTVERGEFVAVMGSSGSGKSTLMNILGCLDEPTSGRYLLDGADVAGMGGREQSRIRNERIGFVFQSFNLLRRVTALRNVEMPLVYAGVSRRERRQRALAALTEVGLADRVGHQPSQLSGGQQQRVAVARAIIAEPALVLADEPTGNLDSTATREVLKVLAGLHEQGRTIVLITHEPEVARWAGRTVVLHDGAISSDARHEPVRSGAL